MESVFCFQIAVDTLKLRRKVICSTPCIAVVFLEFPTILIHLNEVKHAKNNQYNFHKGKSCLFKISPTELFNRLGNTPIFLLVLDQKDVIADGNCNQQVCVGSTSFYLDEAMKIILQGIQNCGLCKASSHGDSLGLPIVDNLQNVVGCVNIVYKLTCLGHTILPHLPDSNSIFLTDKENISDYVVPKEHISTIENVDYPPSLYFRSEKPQQNEEYCQESAITIENNKDISISNSSNNQEVIPSKEVRKKVVTDWQQKMQTFLAINPMCGQKSESTQTDLEHLQQFPILKALIDEVVTLGLNKPSTFVPTQSIVVPERQPIPIIPERAKQKPRASNIKVAKPLKPAPRVNYFTKQQPPPPKVQVKKKCRYPLTFGLTKTHILRASINKQPDFSQTYTKPIAPVLGNSKKNLLKKSPKKRTPRKLVSAFTQTSHVKVKKAKSVPEAESIDSNPTSDSESIELPFNLAKDMDDASYSPDKSSPRVLSRQSIEIRLPSAMTEASHVSTEKLSVDERYTPDIYKYSDDFDDHSISHTHTGSATVDSSLQQTVYDSRDLTDAGSPTRTVENTSPLPDLSQISTLPKTSHDIIPEEPENYESVASSVTDSKETNGTKESLHSSSESQETKREKELHFGLTMQDDDSKPTDESTASVVAALMNSTKLPKPAPSSDSPVIRSLVSEPGSRRPRRPAVSQSSSMERMHRKFKRSSETSFQFSDISIRSSDLADIKTSDISDLKSTDDNISPIHSVDLIGTPELRKK